MRVSAVPSYISRLVLLLHPSCVYYVYPQPSILREQIATLRHGTPTGALRRLLHLSFTPAAPVEEQEADKIASRQRHADVGALQTLHLLSPPLEVGKRGAREGVRFLVTHLGLL